MDSSYTDQCRLLCLGYLQHISLNDSDYDRDDSKVLNKTTTSKIESLNIHLDDILTASQFLADLSLNFEISSVGRVANSVKMIWHDELDRESFIIAADLLLDNDNVTTWEEIALILQMMDRTMRVRGVTELELIVGLTADYLAVSSKQFLSSGDGWKSAFKKPPVAETLSAPQPDEILSSIVMVQEHQSRSPPFSVSPPVVDEERDSLNSATPPEMVDRPPMTSSLMQMMGAGDASNPNAADSSDGTDFEMVGSIHSAVASSPGSPKQRSDSAVELHAVEPVPKKLVLPSSSTSASSSREEEERKNQFPFAAVQDYLPEAATVSEYLPQISLGVAAAAACIGLIALKKASS